MEKPKKLILIISLIVVISIITGVVVLSTYENKVKEPETNEYNTQESTKEEQKEEKPNEENSNQIIPPQTEELPNIDNSNDGEKTESSDSNSDPDKIDKPQTENNDSNSSTTNDKPSNNQSSNSQSSNNQQSTSNNDNTTVKPKPDPKPELKPESEQTSPEVIIVNTSSINLNNYDNNIKITNGGEYTLNGTLNHSLYIEAKSEVTLNLNGVKIYSTEDAAITNINQNNLVINLQERTTNILSDAGSETDYDACLYSNGPLTINGAGILRVVGNRVNDEGIATKNAPITINNGKITIVTKDDGINTGGDGGTISINGGIIYINAGRDGIDSNQDILVNGGTLYTIGSSFGNFSGLDADKGISINGGTVIATGSSWLQIPLLISKQKSLSLGFDSLNNENQIYTLTDETGNEIISFIAKEKFQSITISSNKITGGNYYLYSGGSHSGTLNNHIYEGGTYTKGELMSVNGVSSFTIDNNNSSYTGSSTNIMGLNKKIEITKEINKEKSEINASLLIVMICTCVLLFIAFILNNKIVRGKI